MRYYRFFFFSHKCLRLICLILCLSSGICGGIQAQSWINLSGVRLHFEDTDPNAHEISGDLKIYLPKGEEILKSYQLYWGKNPSEKLAFSGPICGLVLRERDIKPEKGAQPCLIRVKEDSQEYLTYQFIDNNPVPQGATHFLLYVQGVIRPVLAASLAIHDLGLPEHTAQDLSLVDEDPDEGQLAGKLEIMPPEDEKNVTHYSVYWGKGENTKLSSPYPIAVIGKTESLFRLLNKHLTYTFPQDTVIPGEATHILVYSGNNQGEMTRGISLRIEDLGCGCNTLCHNPFSFNQADEECLPATAPVSGIFLNGNIKDQPPRLTGSLWVTRNKNVVERSKYILYWGNSHKEKLDGYGPMGVFFSTLAQSFADVYHFEQTLVPPGAEYLILTPELWGEQSSYRVLAKLPVQAESEKQENSPTEEKKDNNQLKKTIGISLSSPDGTALLETANNFLTRIIDFTGSNETEESEGNYNETNGILFFDFPLSPHSFLRTQLSLGKATGASEGNNIVEIERNILSLSYRRFLPGSWWNLGIEDLFIGAGLGYGRTYFRYDGREFTLDPTASDDNSQISAIIETERPIYRAVSNGVVGLMDLGWYSRKYPFHFGYQFVQYLSGKSSDFSGNQIPDFSNHRERTKDSWENAKRISQIYTGFHYFF